MAGTVDPSSENTIHTLGFSLSYFRVPAYGDAGTLIDKDLEALGTHRYTKHKAQGTRRTTRQPINSGDQDDLKRSGRVPARLAPSSGIRARKDDPATSTPEADSIMVAVMRSESDPVDGWNASREMYETRYATS